jgi:hypothetical protein
MAVGLALQNRELMPQHQDRHFLVAVDALKLTGCHRYPGRAPRSTSGALVDGSGSPTA